MYVFFLKIAFLVLNPMLYDHFNNSFITWPFWLAVHSDSLLCGTRLCLKQPIGVWGQVCGQETFNLGVPINWGVPPIAGWFISLFMFISWKSENNMDVCFFRKPPFQCWLQDFCITPWLWRWQDEWHKHTFGIFKCSFIVFYSYPLVN